MFVNAEQYNAKAALEMNQQQQQQQNLVSRMFVVKNKIK